MNLRREARWLWPIGLLVFLAVLSSAYVLNKQRLESPLDDRYGINLEFIAVDGVVPGLGAPVTVAGVGVGQIDGAKLENGRGVLHVTVDPKKLPRVYSDARAALVPNTPVKDMQIRLYPGTRGSAPMGDDGTIAVRSTTSPVDADELLRGLDGDTRTWMQTLIAGLGTGVEGRGRDIRSLLKNLGPTAAQMRQISGLLGARRRQIAALVHNLSTISRAAARGDDELRQVVDAGNATLATLSENQDSLRSTLRLLPETLTAAESTLERTPRFAGSLARAIDDLDPSLRSLPRTVRATPGATRGLIPLPAPELTKFIDGVSPLRPYIKPAARDFDAASAPLIKAFGALGRTTNKLAYKPSASSEPYLFWLAWFAHNANSMLSTQDAHGSVVRGFVMFSCSSYIASTQTVTDLLGSLLGFQGTCPGDRG